MKRMLMAVLLCLLVCCGANAETVMEGEVSTITFTYQDYQNRALKNTFYLSDEEIWFNFLNGTTNGELVCFNADGQVVDEWHVQTITGEDPTILCMNRVDGNTLLGCVDFNSVCGEVIVFDQKREEVARYTLPVNMVVAHMSPTLRGMLVMATTDDGKSKGNYCLMEIGADGNALFEKQIPFTMEAGAPWYAGLSRLATDGENYYLLAKNGMANTLMDKAQLMCLNPQGEILWTEEVHRSFPANDLAVLNGYIYLVGCARNRQDEYGYMVKRQAAILCYAVDGTRQWLLAYPEVSGVENGCYIFQSVAEGAGRLYAVSNWSDSQTYAVEIEVDGDIGMLKHLVLAKTGQGKVYVNEHGRLVFLGDQGDELYIRTVE